MRHIDWLACRYVAIDVEGTASPAGHAEQLVEVAAVEFLLARWTGRTVHSLVNPGCPISPIGTRIHGLRDTDVASQPPMMSVCPRLADLVDGAVVVAHNARVDWTLVHRDCPSLLALAAIDTLRLSRRLWPEIRKHGLDAVIERLGVQVVLPLDAGRSGRHSALHDATATALVFQQMVETVRSRGLELTETLNGCVVRDAGTVTAERRLDLLACDEGAVIDPHVDL
jgi:DNA polymerase III epsilon subunit-like protein